VTEFVTELREWFRAVPLSHTLGGCFRCCLLLQGLVDSCVREGEDVSGGRVECGYFRK
jgi:hypothetical protein